MNRVETVLTYAPDLPDSVIVGYLLTLPGKENPASDNVAQERVTDTQTPGTPQCRRWPLVAGFLW